MRFAEDQADNRKLSLTSLTRLLGFLLPLYCAGYYLYLRWQRYQQLVCATENVLQKIAALPKTSPLHDTVLSKTSSPHFLLSQLIQQVNQQIFQHNLRLLALQQPLAGSFDEKQTVELQAEIAGYYPAILSFFQAWPVINSSITIQEITLQRSMTSEEIILSLRLLVANILEKS